MRKSMMVFDGPGYGEYYIILAETTQEALDKLKGYMLSHIGRFEDEYPKWKDATLNNLPDRFTIRSDNCDVIVAEWS